MIYLTNGNMPLNAAYSDEIVQEDNSTYQLSFRFPTSDPLWEKLKEETFLTADDLHGEQDFVIFEVEKKHGYIQVYANQVFTLLNNYVVNPISLDRQTGSTALSRFAGSITRDNPFSFFSDIEDRHTFNIGSKNAMEAFAKDKHSIIGQWGGDLVRHSYQVRLLKKGGSENESLFMYKKNLSSYQHKTSTKSLKTRITFTTTVKGEGEKAPDRTFTVTIDSPLINKYSQIYEDVIEVNDQDVKDEASLRKYGEQYYRTSLCDMMEDSLEIEVVGQSDVPVQMFDVVSIFHESYNLDVRKKITKYTYSPMAKKLKSIGFGQFQSGLANAIGNAVSDAVKGEAQQLQGIFEWQLARELKNADLAFDRRKEELVKQFTDDVNAINAKAEETKQEIFDSIGGSFELFRENLSNSVQVLTDKALEKAGASTLLAQEAKRIGLDSVAKLEEFKKQATSAQTALSGDLDVLKQTVNNEVNQASEHRRTTTEALSRMTGQMNGFATKSEVKQDINGLTQTFAKMKVGGTNLLKGSKGPFLPDRKPANFDNNILYVGNTSIYMEQGQEYIISAKTDGNFTAYHDGNKESDNVVLWIMDKDVRNYQIVSDLKTGTTGTKIIWNKPTGIYHLRVNTYHKEATKSVWDVKIEKGNIATDWSPAIEDVESQITEARTEFKQTADGLSTKMAAVETYVGQDNQRQESLRRYTREESARQATTVRELIARDYVGKSTHQEDVRGLERRFEAITNPQNGTIATQIANYKQSVDGRFADITSLISGKANQTDFQRVKETSQLYERILGNTDNGIANNVARMALTSQLFQVEVSKALKGGRNYIRNGQFKNGSKNWIEYQSVNFGLYFNYQHSKDPNNRNRPGAHFFHDSQNVANFFGLQQAFAFEGIRGEKVSVSLLVSKDGGDSYSGLRVALHYIKNKNIIGQEWQGIPSEQITSKYKRFTFTFTLSDDVDQMNLMLFGEKGKTINLYVTDIQLERGSVATDYKEASEDTDEAIRSVQSQLTGSWAVQNLTSAGSIVSQINATNNQILIEAEKIRLKGKTLLDELTAIQGYFKRLFVGEGTFATLNADVIRTNSITADKLVMDMAMARRFVSSDLFTDTLAAKEAFINKLRSVVVTATLLEGYRGRIGGFQIGTHDNDPSSFWLTGLDQFKVGMSNGRGREFQTAFWANWGNTWGKPGPLSWYVTLDGQMYCNNNATFHRVVDFSSTCSANFYGANSFYKDIYMRNGSEIYGTGSTPRAGGKNSVVWWNQVGDGSLKYHIDMASDKRLKENIVDSNIVALDKIKQLKMKSFDFISSGKHEEVGLIAQEVEAILPSVISKNPEKADDYLHIDYVAIVPYLIKSIQELNQKIEEMEKTVA